MVNSAAITQKIRASRHSHLRHVIENYEDYHSSQQFENNNLNVAFIPDENTEDILDSSGDESDYAEEENFPGGSYEIIFNSYNDQQKLLEPNHTYEWASGDNKHDPINQVIMSNTIFCQKIRNLKLKRCLQLVYLNCFFLMK